MSMSYEFIEEIWLYHGDGAWYFITLPVEYAEEIKHIAAPLKRGFGSIKVSATIGSTTWNTSIFPDSKSKSYLMPIKKEVRLENHLHEGMKSKVVISIVGIE